MMRNTSTSSHVSVSSALTSSTMHDDGNSSVGFSSRLRTASQNSFSVSSAYSFSSAGSSVGSSDDDEDYSDMEESFDLRYQGNRLTEPPRQLQLTGMVGAAYAGGFGSGNNKLFSPVVRRTLTSLAIAMTFITAFTVASVGYSVSQTMGASSILKEKHDVDKLRTTPARSTRQQDDLIDEAGETDINALLDYDNQHSGRVQKILDNEGTPQGSMVSFEARDASYGLPSRKTEPEDKPVDTSADVARSADTATSQDAAGNADIEGLAPDAENTSSLSKEISKMSSEDQQLLIQLLQQQLLNLQKPNEGRPGSSDGVGEEAEETSSDTGADLPDGSEITEGGDAAEAGADYALVVDPLVQELMTESRLGLGNYKDAWDQFKDSEDMPVLLNIPFSGGTVVETIIGQCHGMIVADGQGTSDGHEYDNEIGVVYIGNDVPGSEPTRHINVNTWTVQGINRAKEMRLISSQLASFINTPLIFQANSLFEETSMKGRVFTIIRHPVGRAVARYHKLYSGKGMTLEEYAVSNAVEENYFTRYLSGNFGGEISHQDMEVAVDVLRTKFLVGHFENLRDSMDRFERYFRWKYKINPTSQEACRESQFDHMEIFADEELPTSGPVFDTIAARNQFDIQLYDYTKQLFEEQGEFVGFLGEDYRNVDATCCQCDDPPTC